MTSAGLQDRREPGTVPKKRFTAVTAPPRDIIIAPRPWRAVHAALLRPCARLIIMLPSANPVYFEGWATKRSVGGGAFANWKRRYLVIKRTHIAWFKSDKDAAAAGSLNLTRDATAVRGKSPTELSILTDGKQLQLQADDATIGAICSAMEAATQPEALAVVPNNAFSKSAASLLQMPEARNPGQGGQMSTLANPFGPRQLASAHAEQTGQMRAPANSFETNQLVDALFATTSAKSATTSRPAVNSSMPPLANPFDEVPKSATTNPFADESTHTATSPGTAHNPFADVHTEISTDAASNVPIGNAVTDGNTTRGVESSSAQPEFRINHRRPTPAGLPSLPGRQKPSGKRLPAIPTEEEMEEAEEAD